MALRRIGILGGMGPEATILLQTRVLRAVAAQDDQDHVPLIIDMYPQVPSRIDWILGGTGTDPGPVLADMARRLERAGAEALAMPCNTAHHFAPEIEAAVRIPFLNMPNLAAAEALRQVGEGGKVGVLASPAVRKTGLFDKALAGVGCTACYPKDQDALLASIRRIKAHGPQAEDRSTLERAARDLSRQGVGCTLVGCSEFSLLSAELRSDVPLIDTLDVLVGAIVQASSQS